METSSLMGATYDRRGLTAAPHFMCCPMLQHAQRRRAADTQPRPAWPHRHTHGRAGPCRPRPGRRILVSMNHYRARPRRNLPGSPFNAPEAVVQPAETEHYAVSDKVTHDKYGLGTVIGVEEGISVLIDFGSHKQRLRTPCAKLTKL